MLDMRVSTERTLVQAVTMSRNPYIISRMTKLYHSTSAEASSQIELVGFLESSLQDVVFGVWLSDRPLDHGDGVAHRAATCYCIEVPFGIDLSEYEAINEGKPFEAYREWIVPADLVNTWRRSVVESDD